MNASAGVTVSLGLHAFPSGEARFEAVPLLAVARPFSSLVDHLLATTPSEDEERVSVLKAARDMLEYRKLKPVKVQVWYDDAWLGATANVERGDPLSHAALWAESWPPREFTMRVVTDEVLAALEAPRCLLAIIDPGGFLCNALLPIDEAALQTPLLDIAARLQRPYGHRRPAGTGLRGCFSGSWSPASPVPKRGTPQATVRRFAPGRCGPRATASSTCLSWRRSTPSTRRWATRSIRRRPLSCFTLAAATRPIIPRRRA